ncbi:WD40/YVTN/BNR-like repeat-containing protein [Ottowia testudinis]|uniref:Exo-alpha-sialidase n=1 Tax=Ottowia testudinis TaxID=2816950 RepID=A0A975CDR5_9BURK|nr:hypothetical protein [Ottowia testudinis]QTD43992.1 hypothetical protein J1M35_12670 [Ottowia testudinis]
MALLGLGAASAFALPPPIPSYTMGDLHVAANGALLVSHTSGTFRSTDEGQSWQKTSGIFGGRFFPVGQSGLYLVNQSSLNLSLDGGANWKKIADWLANTARKIFDIRDSAGSARIYAVARVAAADNSQADQSQFQFSRDQGKTWLPLPAPSSTERCCAIYAAAHGYYVTRTDNQIFKTKNLAGPWAEIPPPPAFDRASEWFLDADGWIYVNALVDVSSNSESVADVRIYRTRDDGQHWERLWFGPRGKKTNFRLIGIDKKVLYFECNNHFCKSADGATQQRLTDQFFPGTELRFGPQGVFTLSTGRVTVHHLNEKTQNWDTLGTQGLPDPFSGK